MECLLFVVYLSYKINIIGVIFSNFVYVIINVLCVVYTLRYTLYSYCIVCIYIIIA